MEDQINILMQSARASLDLGRRLSKQGSYGRRSPSPKSLPHFGKVRSLLEEVLIQRPNDGEALIMMSHLSECLLDFNAAIGFLERALALGEQKTSHVMKRLARLRENVIFWQDLRLDPDSLNALGRFPESRDVGPNDTTMRLTQEWLKENNIAQSDDVIAAMERRGAFSDFQVLENVVRG